FAFGPAGASYSPADYLDIYMHALPKNTQSSAPRQVIAFRTLRHADDVSQEDRAEYQREMDVMLNRLIDTFNISPPTIPSSGKNSASSPFFRCTWWDSWAVLAAACREEWTTVWATGIRIMLALNDAEEHAQRLIEQEPWPAPNVYGTTLHTNEPADRLRLRWNSSTISPLQYRLICFTAPSGPWPPHSPPAFTQ
ncbi:unnamed protein product, partial [Mesorhabditis spiculigera]